MTFSLKMGSFPIIFGRQSDVSLQFADGKGVSGKIADVSVAPGGGAFSITCTHDGEWPEARPDTPIDGYTTEFGGQLFTQAQWEAVQEYVRGANARPEMLCDAPKQGAEGDDPSGDVRFLTGELTRTRLERDLARDRNEALSQQHRKVAQRVSGLEKALSVSRGDVGELESRLQATGEREQANLARIRVMEQELEDACNELAQLRRAGQASEAKVAELVQELSFRDLADNIVQNDLTIGEAQKRTRDMGGRLEVGVIDSSELTFHSQPRPPIIVNVSVSDALTSSGGE